MYRKITLLTKFAGFIFITFSIFFAMTHAYGFVGGAHGGFSGGGYSGGYAGGVYHGGEAHDYSSESHSFIKALSIYGGILFAITFYLCIKNIFYKTRLGKSYFKYQQKKYLKKCRHTPKKSKRRYSLFEIETSIHYLTKNAMNDLSGFSSVANLGYEQIIQNAINSFKHLQNAWGRRQRNKILRACSNPKYSSKLCDQLSKMESMGVYNFIDDTKISECHLVKCYTPLFSKTTILCFILKGTQIDEYTIKKHYMNPGYFELREFNCWLEVIPYEHSFKIYKVKIDKHIDDLVIKEAKAIKR